jgi:nitrogen fixation protein NifU and related proteins
MTQQGYTKELMKHFQKPKFVKKLKNPDGVGEVGNMKCGDIMHLEIKVDEKRNEIKDIGFQTFGCPAAVASSDVVCEIAKGRTLNKAMKITKEDIVRKLGGMPSIKLHCSILGIQALHNAIKDYLEKENRK